jgi:hypothetical protein
MPIYHFRSVKKEWTKLIPGEIIEQYSEEISTAFLLSSLVVSRKSRL